MITNEHITHGHTYNQIHNPRRLEHITETSGFAYICVQNSVHLPLQTLQEHHEETQNWLLSVGQYHLFSRLDVAVSGACRLTSKPLSTTVEVTWKYFSLQIVLIFKVFPRKLILIAFPQPFNYKHFDNFSFLTLKSIRI